MDEKSATILAQYLQNYWDSANLIVTAMFTLTFGVYVTFATVKASRLLAQRYCWPLVVLALAGNLLLIYLIIRLGNEEMALLATMPDSPAKFGFETAARAANRFRVYLLLANLAMYLAVLIVIRLKTRRK